MYSFAEAAKWGRVFLVPSSAVRSLSVRVKQVSVDGERSVLDQPSEEWMSNVEFFQVKALTQIALESFKLSQSDSVSSFAVAFRSRRVVWSGSVRGCSSKFLYHAFHQVAERRLVVYEKLTEFSFS